MTRLTFAQIPTSIAFSTLPPYNGDSTVVGDGGPRAFWDATPNQIVVVVPNAAKGNAPATIGFDLANRVRPTVSWSVNFDSKKFSYQYLITDSIQSAQRTSKMIVLAPEHDTSLARLDKSAWSFTTVSTNFPDRTATVAMASMRAISWQDPGLGSAKINSLGLGMTSSYAPGFCDAFVQGLTPNPITDVQISQMPESVAADLRKATSPGIGSVAVSVMCPLFRSSAPSIVVASNYYLGIQRLVRGAQLDEASPWVQGMMAYLREFLAAGGVGPLVAPNLDAGTPLERNIQQAISFSAR